MAALRSVVNLLRTPPVTDMLQQQFPVAFHTCLTFMTIICRWAKT